MKNRYIQYKELLKRQNHLKNLKKWGVEIILKKNQLKIYLGVGCLVVAVIPNGTAFFMLPLGLMLLGLSLKDVEKYKDDFKFKLWLRCNK